MVKYRNKKTHLDNHLISITMSWFSKK